MARNDIYAKTRVVTDLASCYFYHTMELPRYGLVEGEWDLREGIHEYFGGEDFEQKRVLEIGTASGFGCFYMESQGAEVVAYDLSKDFDWDIVPFGRGGKDQSLSERKAHIDRINNAWWLAHRAYNSNAKVVYGNVYRVPAEIGAVDAAIFGNVLLHVRDPFLALQNALRLTKETVIIVDVPPTLSRRLLSKALHRLGKSSSMVFVPDYRRSSPLFTWWTIPEELMKNFIGVLGFEETEVKYHYQKYLGRQRLLYSIVGRRTTGGIDAVLKT